MTIYTCDVCGTRIDEESVFDGEPRTDKPFASDTDGSFVLRFVRARKTMEGKVVDHNYPTEVVMCPDCLQQLNDGINGFLAEALKKAPKSRTIRLKPDFSRCRFAEEEGRDFPVRDEARG